MAVLKLFIQMKDGYSWCVKALDNISRVLLVSVDNTDFFNSFKRKALLEKLVCNATYLP